MSDLERVIETLRAAPSVAVLAHVSPDTDSIGATLGAALALREAGKVTGVYNADPLPPELLSLPGASDLRREVQSGQTYACYLVLDTSNLERTGGLLSGRPAGAVVLNVDHHASNSRFGDVNWVEPEASSAGEMVYRILRRGGFPIGKTVATNLYAAILADTGSFQYGNATPESLRVAADLVECGAAVEDVARWLFGSRDPREWHLLSEALASLRLSRDGRVAWIEVTCAAQSRAGLGLEVSEDFVNYVRAIRGVEIAIAFKEVSPTTLKVSFRSRGGLDVTRLAGRFGGGGHRNAAGCTLSGELAEARTRVLEAAEAYLISEWGMRNAD
ncbi:MAG: bifunctional oligoribonuclease/PAP phosphatase NrnA [candidate division NC10 bacterium]|nr:bifunctional oligoribonuclease/PAP phosphatase NrnA [candidate division NC10 bacterium]